LNRSPTPKLALTFCHGVWAAAEAIVNDTVLTRSLRHPA
jgi:hypothetical protein